MSYISDSLSDLTNMIVAPRQAYASIAKRPIIWFPLLLLVLAWIVVWNWYYAAVDFPWLINHLIADATAHAQPEAHDAIAKGMAGIKPGALVVISSVTVVVIFLALSTIVCFYLQIVSAIVNDPYTLKQWFSFSIWSSIPSLIGILAMVVNFFLAQRHQIGPEQLNPLTLNNLFFHVDSMSPFKRLLDSVDLTLFWSWVLMIFGYRLWTGASVGRSTLVILAPLVVIYGVWILVSALG